MMRMFLLGVLTLAACGGGGSGDDAGDDSVGDDSSGDDGPDTGCTGQCAMTSVDAIFVSTRNLTLAWYGVTASENKLYIEVDRGGATACVEENSPTPNYSLVMGSVPIPAADAPVTTDGAMLDYSSSGDLLGGPPVAQGMSITLTPDASNGDPAIADAHLAFDITGTFTGGTVSGHFYALHCASMDE